MGICIQRESIKNIDELEEVLTIKDSMTREKALNKFLDPETARLVNKRYEKTLLARNTEVGYKRFINKLVKENKLTEVEAADLIQSKEAELNRVKKSLADLQEAGYVKDSDILDIEKMSSEVTKKKYGLDLSKQEKDTLIDLSNEISEASKLPKTKDGHYDIKYGVAIKKMEDFSAKLKDPYFGKKLLGKDGRLSKYADIRAEETKDMGKIRTGIYDTINTAKVLNSQAFKTMKATMDASFAAIQGVGSIPRRIISGVIRGEGKQAIRDVRDSFKIAFKSGGKEGYDAFVASIYSHKDYKQAMEHKLRLLSPEETFDSNLPELLFGGIVRKPNNWFSAFQQKTRLTEFSRTKMWEERKIAKLLGLDNYKLGEDFNKLTKEQQGKLFKDRGIMSYNKNITDDMVLDEIASHANKVTGTASFGKYEKNSALFNETMFAPRFALSDIKTYTDVFNPNASKNARIRSAETLAETVGSLVAGYYTYALINPDATETNPTSPNWMKIKIGDTWVGINPKGAWLVKLASKMIAGQEKTAKGDTVVYGEGYKAKTRGSVLMRTLRSKLAPVPAVATDILTGSDFTGNEATFFNELRNLVAPIAPSSILTRVYKDTVLDETDYTVMEHLLRTFADFIGVNNYIIGE